MSYIEQRFLFDLDEAGSDLLAPVETLTATETLQTAKRRIVPQIDREHVTCHVQPITRCCERPSPATPSATSSPGFRYTGTGRIPWDGL